MAGQIVNQAQTATPGTPVTVLHVNTTSQATTGTSEEVLATYTLPANTLSANGKSLRLTVIAATASNANSKTLKIRLTNTAGAQLSSVATSGSGYDLFANLNIVRTGASTAYAFGPAFAFNGTAQIAAAYAISATWSGDVVIVVTGTTPTSAGDITFKCLLVEALN